MSFLAVSEDGILVDVEFPPAHSLEHFISAFAVFDGHFTGADEIVVRLEAGLSIKSGIEFIEFFSW